MSTGAIIEAAPLAEYRSAGQLHTHRFVKACTRNINTVALEQVLADAMPVNALSEALNESRCVNAEGSRQRLLLIAAPDHGWQGICACGSVLGYRLRALCDFFSGACGARSTQSCSLQGSISSRRVAAALERAH